MSNAPTLIDLESQPQPGDSQDYYGWVETQVDSPTLPQSLPDMEEEVPNTQPAEEEEKLPNTQPAALVDSCTQEQHQPSLKRARAEFTPSTSNCNMQSRIPSLKGATATSSSSLLPIASTCVPPTASEHRASDPMKFRGTMPLTCIMLALETVSAKYNAILSLTSRILATQAQENQILQERDILHYLVLIYRPTITKANIVDHHFLSRWPWNNFVRHLDVNLHRKQPSRKQFTWIWKLSSRFWVLHSSDSFAWPWQLSSRFDLAAELRSLIIKS